jgi:hypothetical protein
MRRKVNSKTHEVLTIAELQMWKSLNLIQSTLFYFMFRVFISCFCTTFRARWTGTRVEEHILALTQMQRDLQYRIFICNLPVIIRISFSRRLLGRWLNRVQSSRSGSVSLRRCKERCTEATWIPGTFVTRYGSIIKYFIQSQHIKILSIIHSSCYMFRFHPTVLRPIFSIWR